MKLFGVTQASALARMGLQNGDRLETLNGVPIGNPTYALDAHSQLRGATRPVLVLGLERRGAHLDIHYAIEDD